MNKPAIWKQTYVCTVNQVTGAVAVESREYSRSKHGTVTVRDRHGKRQQRFAHESWFNRQFDATPEGAIAKRLAQLEQEELNAAAKLEQVRNFIRRVREFQGARVTK